MLRCDHIENAAEAELLPRASQIPAHFGLSALSHLGRPAQLRIRSQKARACDSFTVEDTKSEGKGLRQFCRTVEHLSDKIKAMSNASCIDVAERRASLSRFITV